MSSSTMTPASATDTVRWGQGPFEFELNSSDPRLRARATQVFRPWSRAAEPAAMVRRWSVEAESGDDSWCIRHDASDPLLHRSDIRQAVTAVEYDAIRALLEGPPDVLTFHAALIARGDRGVLVLGPKEAGKSTLACALWRHGLSFLGDDVAIVDPATGDARSAPRRVSLRSPSLALLGETFWERITASPSGDATDDGHLFHPDEVDGCPRLPSVRLGAAVFLARHGVPAPDGGTRRIEAAQAVLALLPYSNLVRRLDAGEVIGRVAPLAAVVPSYDCARAPLPDMISAIERILDGGG